MEAGIGGNVVSWLRLQLNTRNADGKLLMDEILLLLQYKLIILGGSELIAERLLSEQSNDNKLSKYWIPSKLAIAYPEQSIVVLDLINMQVVSNWFPFKQVPIPAFIIKFLNPASGIVTYWALVAKVVQSSIARASRRVLMVQGFASTKYPFYIIII